MDTSDEEWGNEDSSSGPENPYEYTNQRHVMAGPGVPFNHPTLRPPQPQAQWPGLDHQLYADQQRFPNPHPNQQRFQPPAQWPGLDHQQPFPAAHPSQQRLRSLQSPAQCHEHHLNANQQRVRQPYPPELCQQQLPPAHPNQPLLRMVGYQFKLNDQPVNLDQQPVNLNEHFPPMPEVLQFNGNHFQVRYPGGRTNTFGVHMNPYRIEIRTPNPPPEYGGVPDDNNQNMCANPNPASPLPMLRDCQHLNQHELIAPNHVPIAPDRAIPVYANPVQRAPQTTVQIQPEPLNPNPNPNPNPNQLQQIVPNNSQIRPGLEEPDLNPNRMPGPRTVGHQANSIQVTAQKAEPAQIKKREGSPIAGGSVAKRGRKRPNKGAAQRVAKILQWKNIRTLLECLLEMLEKIVTEKKGKPRKEADHVKEMSSLISTCLRLLGTIMDEESDENDISEKQESEIKIKVEADAEGREDEHYGEGDQNTDGAQ